MSWKDAQGYGRETSFGELCYVRSNAYDYSYHIIYHLFTINISFYLYPHPPLSTLYIMPQAGIVKAPINKQALLSVDRRNYVLNEDYAYEDSPQPIGYGATIR